MYIAKAHIELITNVRYGGTTSSIKMFEQTIEVEVTLRDWILWVEQGIFAAYKYMPTLCPEGIKQLDENTITFSAAMELSTSSDTLEYYQELVSQGWIPNIEAASAIRSWGFKQFYPEKF
jgi:hypothetical protein